MTISHFYKRAYALSILTLLNKSTIIEHYKNVKYTTNENVSISGECKILVTKNTKENNVSPI